MVEIKTALRFLDIFWSIVCGYLTLDFFAISVINAAGGITYVMSEIDNAIKVAMAFAGLLYFLARFINYSFTSYVNYQMKVQELKIKVEEAKIKEEEASMRNRINLRAKWEQEFIEKFEIKPLDNGTENKMIVGYLSDRYKKE
jgi:hypothetical protein